MSHTGGLGDTFPCSLWLNAPLTFPLAQKLTRAPNVQLFAAKNSPQHIHNFLPFELQTAMSCEKTDCIEHVSYI